MSNIAYVQKFDMAGGKFGLVLQKCTDTEGVAYYRLPLLVNTEVIPARPLCQKVFRDDFLGDITVMAFDAVEKIPEAIEHIANIEVVPGESIELLVKTYDCRREGVQLSLTSGAMIISLLPDIRTLTATGNFGWFTKINNRHSGRIYDSSRSIFR
jgi:hypothetical protein